MSREVIRLFVALMTAAATLNVTAAWVVARTKLTNGVGAVGQAGAELTPACNLLHHER